MTEIYIRPLRMGDEVIAYHWRNNPEVWKYTGSRPDIVVTEEIERQWMERVLAQTNVMRYAICIKETDEYIGNVTLTDIEQGRAQFHTHIGATRHWGKGISSQATRMMLEMGFAAGIEEIYLGVHKDNAGALSVYRKCGFVEAGRDGDEIKMTLTRQQFEDAAK